MRPGVEKERINKRNRVIIGGEGSETRLVNQPGMWGETEDEEKNL